MVCISRGQSQALLNTQVPIQTDVLFCSFQDELFSSHSLGRVRQPFPFPPAPFNLSLTPFFFCPAHRLRPLPEHRPPPRHRSRRPVDGRKSRRAGLPDSPRLHGHRSRFELGSSSQIWCCGSERIWRRSRNWIWWCRKWGRGSRRTRDVFENEQQWCVRRDGGMVVWEGRGGQIGIPFEEEES